MKWHHHTQPENAERLVERDKKEIDLRLYIFKSQANQVFFVQWC